MTLLDNNQNQGDYSGIRIAELNLLLALANSKFSGLWDDRDLAHLVLLTSTYISSGFCVVDLLIFPLRLRNNVI